MALFNFRSLKKNYKVPVRCWNCNYTDQEYDIPKGNLIDEYLKMEGALCPNCKNPSLRRINKIETPKDIDKRPFPVVTESKKSNPPIKTYMEEPQPMNMPNPTMRFFGDKKEMNDRIKWEKDNYNKAKEQQKRQQPKEEYQDPYYDDQGKYKQTEYMED
jgi:hypothetical protein